MQELTGPGANSKRRDLLLCIGAVSLIWAAGVWFHGTERFAHLQRMFGSLWVHFARPDRHSVPAERLQVLGEPFAGVLSSLFAGKEQLGTDGKLHQPKVDDGITVSEGLFLYELTRRTGARNTLEVGFASGFSAMFFLAGLKSTGGNQHIAIDPFELQDYSGIGLQNVKEVNMEQHFRHLPDFSALAIPALAKEGRKFEVIFIDGNHRFDDAFVDFTLADNVCAPGGYIVLHDYWMPSVQRVTSFIEKNRSDYVAEHSSSTANLRVFRKVGKDDRSWTHYVPF